jgi:hypothetical protein
MNGKKDLSDLYPDLSYNIRELRKELGLTQKELAEIAKISYRTIQNYENGVTPPSLNIIEKIALALGVSVERLISNYVFDNNTTATEILDKINNDKVFNQKINNLILTDIIFDIVDLEMRYKHETLDEKALDNSIGGKNNISYNTKYYLVKLLLEKRLNKTIDDLKKEMSKNYLNIREVYRSKDNSTGYIIDKERY